MQLNNVDMAIVGLNWNTNDQEWFAETHSDADHVVGGTKHHSAFGSVSYLYNGRWYSPNVSDMLYNTTTNGLIYGPSGSTFYVWDTRVS